MKVLLAVHPNRPNRIINNLYRGIKSTQTSVDVSLDKFWNPDSGLYDIIHIQWPEALISWNWLDLNQVKNIERQISRWKEMGSKIIITRHNYLPHRENPLNEYFYRTIYEKSDGIIHLGNYSKDEFLQRYPQITYCNHTVIPHPWYDTTPNFITMAEARSQLGISASEKVFVVFGNIRLAEEQQLVINGFNACPIKDKRLLITRGRLYDHHKITGRIRSVKYLQRKSYRFFNRQLLRRQNIWVWEDFVPEIEIQKYLNAADVVIIQRFNHLNSGNIPLGFSFKKVVVGPKTGNITEILESTNNPVYDPNDINSLSTALSEGLKLAEKDHGEKNYQFAQLKWNTVEVGTAHVNFYAKVNSKLKIAQ